MADNETELHQLGSTGLVHYGIDGTQQLSQLLLDLTSSSTSSPSSSHVFTIKK